MCLLKEINAIISRSSVRFLDSSSGAGTTVLLGFASSRISDQKTSVVLQKSLLDLSLLGLVDVLLIVSDDSFGNGLSDSIDLGNVSWASNSHSDVQVLESVQAQKENRFHDLDSQCSGFKDIDGGAINSEHSLACSHGSDSNSVLLFAEGLHKLSFGLWHDYQ